MTFVEYSELRLYSKVVWLSETLYLTIDIILDLLVKKKFPLLYLEWYLSNVVTGNRYLLRGSNGNVLPLVMHLLPYV